MSATPTRDALLPYMKEYDRAFSDSGPVNWSPFTVFTHPTNFCSDVVTTDELGFRTSIDTDGTPVSLAKNGFTDDRAVNLLAGSSTAFGIGASSDAQTLASLLSKSDRSGRTWLNFGGRSFNAIQEYLLAALYQHRLQGGIDKIVILSGFNNLGLARQPTWATDDHGTFFMWQRYRSLVEPGDMSILKRLRQHDRSALDGLWAGFEPPATETQIRTAANTVERALRLWTPLARTLGAELTYVLQPLANWVRTVPNPQESRIFTELDKVGGFTDAYGDILTNSVHQRYSDLLAKASSDLGIRYVDSVPLFADSLASDDWAYVDRIHFTDAGHETFADTLSCALC